MKLNIFGQQHIESVALHQMHQAMKLPVSTAGALMPDAHAGYGLPIGGVLAVEDAVIPFAVGVDIGCRMHLSLFDITPRKLDKRSYFFTNALLESTCFGSGNQFEKASNHAIMEDPLFREVKWIGELQKKAWKQLGSSGSGNHFVEWGKVTLQHHPNHPDLPAGEFIGLLSHSGSRALGANIANYFTRLAARKRKLNQDLCSLSWLWLHEQEGAEYWAAMQLAGRYATACHEVIHEKLARELGQRPVATVSNHHNFAWKETIDGITSVVHRKGATPAGKGVAGIIPGSMTTPGFIVSGRGNSSSLQSASHGAGRKMSRSKARAAISAKELNQALQKAKVTLLGGGTDEAPHAYKDIHKVMLQQQELVEVIGTFQPVIVRMDK
ncbi:RtcB family protein [Flavihumibacter petaseus]|uniref:3'-phosphate/5'-hydroxy nucleic acid ligase n=1 Tax=Flavihumibacter petaseus NBRC 106054 TaxID=1220578 RepID=A0A0E9MYJ8_9BACT|nr:RtcB family protein [Flavihumibacter petaseus]GAO42481.1 hypothetical protein FPE01S_01_14950 [Flavihumibacter petaseus NBRC 106054]